MEGSDGWFNGIGDAPESWSGESSDTPSNQDLIGTASLMTIGGCIFLFQLAFPGSLKSCTN